MQQIATRFDNEYAFCAGSVQCVYKVERRGEEVHLSGLETEGDALLFRRSLRFSRDQEKQVCEFARILAESQTFPRMMIELAEEYFSSAFFD